MVWIKPVKWYHHKTHIDLFLVVQETVYKAPLIADFNKEQEDFIRTKSDKELPSAPWAGYQNENELRDKILALSDDKRNVLRAPPSGVNFDFEYSNVTSPALMLLEVDPKLKQLRYDYNNMIFMYINEFNSF